MQRRLTTKQFWKNYWSDEKIDKLIKANPYFSNLLKLILSSKIHRFIEIGGFPGIYAFYVSRTFNIKVALLDYIMEDEAISKVADFYGQKKDEVSLIQADFFRYIPRKKYDLVFSSGFIEHFRNTDKVIEKHLDYLSSGGKLLITLPNYLGMNGYLQKKFDPQHYYSHNTRAMDIKNLEKIMNALPLVTFRVYYYGNSGVWFEELDQKPAVLKILVYIFYLLRFPLGIFNLNSRLLSPHIIIEAKKR